nr:LptA/OstA family protein [Pyxidicoccus fallax]
MAFFVAQPVPAAGAAPTDAGTPPAAGAPGTLAPPAQSPGQVQIKADLITGEKTQAVLTGNVRATHRTLDLRCDKSIAYYTQPREVTRVVCTGSVQAQDGDRMARGERAEYDVPSGVLVVTGSPEARQGTTYMRGTKVRLTLGSERLEVENAVIIFEPPPSDTPAPRRRGTGTPARSPAQPPAAPKTPAAQPAPADGGTSK